MCDFSHWHPLCFLVGVLLLHVVLWLCDVVVFLTGTLLQLSLKMCVCLLTNINMHPELHLKIISVCPHPHPFHHVRYHLEASKLLLVWWSMTANSDSRLAELSLHLVHHTSNFYKKYQAFPHYFHVFRCCVTIHGHCLGRMNLMVLY